MALLRRIFESLDPSSSLTTDVRFLFKGESGVAEVKAHKLILGGASDVFEREFFGPLKKDEDIYIEDVSDEVFRVMIDYIYSKKVELIDYDLDFLSSLYYLADLYNIEELRLDIISSVPEHVVSEQNFLDVAVLAENYNLYQRLSETLYDSAAAFIKQKFDGKIDNVFNFFSEIEASEIHGLVLLKIMARMKSLPNTNPKCENCEQTTCLNGQMLTRENFVPTAQVTPSNGNGKICLDPSTYMFYPIFTSVLLCNDGYMGRFKLNNTTYNFTLDTFKYKCI